MKRCVGVCGLALATMTAFARPEAYQEKEGRLILDSVEGHGGAFNWHRPDHFRVVYLPRMGMLRETMGEISDFFSYYWQS